jgi:hypothetical protein
MTRLVQVVTLLLTASAAAAQPATTTRAGPRPLLPRSQEIDLARSAAPAGVSDSARVLVLADSGWVIADSGGSEVTCIVNRSWRDSLEPHCYDEEGARTVMRIEIHRNEQRHRGRNELEIEREIALALASGRFRLPARPAMTFMMSGGQLLYNDDGKRVGRWRPHLMIYYPYLTDGALGLPANPDMRVGMVSQGGTPTSCVMLVMQSFVEPRARAPSP